MAPKQTPPFRAEHVGSLLRPSYLLEARKKYDNKEVTQEQLREVEERAIAEAVNFQREIGLKGITDGEYRRRYFYEGFFENLEGIEDVHNPPLEIFRVYLPDVQAFVTNDTIPASTLLCTGKIKHVKSGYVPQFEAVKKLVHPDEVRNIKITVASPEWLDMHHGEHAFARGVYNSRDEFFKDIATAFRQELAALYAVGCRNVQIDGPLLTFFCDTAVQKGFKDHGEDIDALLDSYIRLYNDCLSERPRDLIVSFHLCRGNWRSHHFVSGGYETIAKKLFSNLNVDSFYLEYDTPRAGTFEPLKYLSKNKSVVLGIITSKFPELEDEEQLAKRVFEAAWTIASGTGEPVQEALQRISISPQCGFASSDEGNLLTAADMKRKLEFVRDLATRIWTDA